MNMKLICFLLLFTFHFSLFTLFAKGPGSSSFEFLNIPVGAREIAMGGGTAISHSPNAYWWNPAGLAYVERPQISLMYNQHFQDITQQRAGVSFPMKNQSAGAVNISMLSIGGIDGYDWFGNPTGEVQASSYYISYTQSRRLISSFMAGLTLKAIVEQLDDIRPFAVAVDAGFILHPMDGFWFSGGIRNVGVSGKVIEKSEKLPFSAFTGLGLKVNEFTLVSGDVLMLDNNFDDIRYGFGVEFDLWDMLFFRGGYNNTADVDELFRLGAGWRWKDISLDYVYAPYGILGRAHLIDLNISFGNPTLIERMYRRALKLYKQKKYEDAWVEFNKVYSLNSNYKKVKIWLDKVENKK